MPLQRSIVITFEDEAEGQGAFESTSALLSNACDNTNNNSSSYFSAEMKFRQRLEDLRERFPQWKISGFVQPIEGGGGGVRGEGKAEIMASSGQNGESSRNADGTLEVVARNMGVNDKNTNKTNTCAHPVGQVGQTPSLLVHQHEGQQRNFSAPKPPAFAGSLLGGRTHLNNRVHHNGEPQPQLGGAYEKLANASDRRPPPPPCYSSDPNTRRVELYVDAHVEAIPIYKRRPIPLDMPTTTAETGAAALGVVGSPTAAKVRAKLDRHGREQHQYQHKGMDGEEERRQEQGGGGGQQEQREASLSPSAVGQATSPISSIEGYSRSIQYKIEGTNGEGRDVVGRRKDGDVNYDDDQGQVILDDDCGVTTVTNSSSLYIKGAHMSTGNARGEAPQRVRAGYVVRILGLADAGAGVGFGLDASPYAGREGVVVSVKDGGKRLQVALYDLATDVFNEAVATAGSNMYGYSGVFIDEGRCGGDGSASEKHLSSSLPAMCDQRELPEVGGDEEEGTTSCERFPRKTPAMASPAVVKKELPLSPFMGRGLYSSISTASTPSNTPAERSSDEKKSRKHHYYQYSLPFPASCLLPALPLTLGGGGSGRASGGTTSTCKKWWCSLEEVRIMATSVEAYIERLEIRHAKVARRHQHQQHHDHDPNAHGTTAPTCTSAAHVGSVDAIDALRQENVLLRDELAALNKKLAAVELENVKLRRKMLLTRTTQGDSSAAGGTEVAVRCEFSEPRSDYDRKQDNDDDDSERVYSPSSSFAAKNNKIFTEGNRASSSAPSPSPLSSLKTKNRAKDDWSPSFPLRSLNVNDLLSTRSGGEGGDEKEANEEGKTTVTKTKTKKRTAKDRSEDEKVEMEQASAKGSEVVQRDSFLSRPPPKNNSRDDVSAAVGTAAATVLLSSTSGASPSVSPSIVSMTSASASASPSSRSPTRKGTSRRSKSLSLTKYNEEGGGPNSKGTREENVVLVNATAGVVNTTGPTKNTTAGPAGSAVNNDNHGAEKEEKVGDKAREGGRDTGTTSPVALLHSEDSTNNCSKNSNNNDNNNHKGSSTLDNTNHFSSGREQRKEKARGSALMRRLADVTTRQTADHHDDSKKNNNSTKKKRQRLLDFGANATSNAKDDDDDDESETEEEKRMAAVIGSGGGGGGDEDRSLFAFCSIASAAPNFTSDDLLRGVISQHDDTLGVGPNSDKIHFMATVNEDPTSPVARPPAQDQTSGKEGGGGFSLWSKLGSVSQTPSSLSLNSSRNRNCNSNQGGVGVGAGKSAIAAPATTSDMPIKRVKSQVKVACNRDRGGSVSSTSRLSTAKETAPLVRFYINDEAGDLKQAARAGVSSEDLFLADSNEGRSAVNNGEGNAKGSAKIGGAHEEKEGSQQPRLSFSSSVTGTGGLGLASLPESRITVEDHMLFAPFLNVSRKPSMSRRSVAVEEGDRSHLNVVATAAMPRNRSRGRLLDHIAYASGKGTTHGDGDDGERGAVSDDEIHSDAPCEDFVHIQDLDEI